MPAPIPNQTRQFGARWLIATLAVVPILYAILARTRVGDADRASVERELETLRIQLAQVENKIKDLIQNIESARLEEADTKEQIEEAQNRKQQLMNNLQKAADAYADLLQSISSMHLQ